MYNGTLYHTRARHRAKLPSTRAACNLSGWPLFPPHFQHAAPASSSTAGSLASSHHYIRLCGLQLPCSFQHRSQPSLLLRYLLLLVARHPTVTQTPVAVAAARLAPYVTASLGAPLQIGMLLLLLVAAAAPAAAPAAARLAPQVQLHHLQAVHVCWEDNTIAQPGPTGSQ